MSFTTLKQRLEEVAPYVRYLKPEFLEPPRQWSDPDREQEDPQEQLADLARRVREALHAWNKTLPHLLPR